MEQDLNNKEIGKMSYMIDWNKIVSQYNKIRNCKEEIVQASWELLFSTIFNYSDSEIDAQRAVQMGSSPKYPDIIIKNNNEDLFVVELKQYTLHIGQEQLFSYLNQLKIDIGILICDKLYIYDFDYTKREENYSFVEIDFKPDNPDGEKFIELFMSDNFDKQKIKEFIRIHNQSKNNIDLIRKELNAENLMQILKNHFYEKYPETDVEEALRDYEIVLQHKFLETSQLVSSDIDIYSDKEHIEYFYKNQNLSKRKLVLNVIKDYVTKHPQITFEELKTLFPDKLQGSCGVFQDDEKMKQKFFKKESEYKKRYFTRPEQKIRLQAEGRTIVVSGEWGDNFEMFFTQARKLGLPVEKKNLDL